MKDLYIITGATGGMGLESAKYFSDKGHLLLLDLSYEKLVDLQSSLKGDVDILKFDITNDNDIDNVISYVEAFGGFKYLLHYAGVSESMGNIELIYKINLVGNKKLLDGLYPHILEGGAVINTASMAGHLTPAPEAVLNVLTDPLNSNFLENILKMTPSNTVAYGWSKNAIINLTRLEGAKWGLKGARIISISPGAIKTPMVEKELEKNKDAINQLIAVTPVKRIGESSDIVNLVSFLISEKASFITGTDILIDGGATESFRAFYAAQNKQ